MFARSLRSSPQRGRCECSEKINADKNREAEREKSEGTGHGALIKQSRVPGCTKAWSR